MVYTTTSANQSVQLIYKQEYAKKITLEDGTDVPITGSGALSYTFADIGEHKVTIKLKEDVNTLFDCFSDCTELTSIPENLFANCPNVTDFSACFYNCGLTSIPENLFANCPNVTDFSTCFSWCTSLTSIPDNLFANCPNVTDFMYCFDSCFRLTSIPENLFANCPNVTDFSVCFFDCTRLTSMPENLFARNTAVTSFDHCFSGCTRLTGNVPIDNDGTPIYNRSGEGKPGYAIVENHSDCFYNCTKMADYDSIPEEWKQ